MRSTTLRGTLLSQWDSPGLRAVAENPLASADERRAAAGELRARGLRVTTTTNRSLTTMSHLRSNSSREHAIGRAVEDSLTSGKPVAVIHFREAGEDAGWYAVPTLALQGDQLAPHDVLGVYEAGVTADGALHVVNRSAVPLGAVGIMFPTR